jgi:acyl phosphate:glycerol-3-phosphate acyltransferase
MAAAIIAAYLLGSIPFALIVSRRLSGVDPRRIGSGNLGATNVARASGIAAGVVVALLDTAKGAVGVIVAERLSSDSVVPAAAGFAAIVGHIYPIWLGFRGGKGVATACGVFSLLTPAAVPPALAIFLLTAWLTRYVSLASLLATIAVAPFAYATGSPAPVVTAALAASIVIVFRHRSNVVRLKAGTERRIGVRV